MVQNDQNYLVLNYIFLKLLKLFSNIVNNSLVLNYISTKLFSYFQ